MTRPPALVAIASSSRLNDIVPPSSGRRGDYGLTVAP